MVPAYMPKVLVLALLQALTYIGQGSELPGTARGFAEHGKDAQISSEARTDDRPLVHLMRRAQKLQQSQLHLSRSAPSQKMNAGRYVPSKATSGKRLLRRRQQSTTLLQGRSGYMLWQDVPGFNGSLCGEDGEKNWTKHTKDVQASRLNHCMDACEAQPWCAQMSFHGDPEGNEATEGNYCILSSHPCIKTAGMDSTLLGAMDDKWMTYNYSNWFQVENMTKRHCSSADSMYQRKQAIDTMEDCMAECLDWSFCQYISYQHWEGNCDLVSECIPEDDENHSEAFHVFQKT